MKVKKMIAKLLLAVSLISPTPILIIGVTSIAVTQTACPSQNDIDRMVKASGELAYDVGLVEDAVREAYLAKKISQEKKNEFADQLFRISKAGKKYNDLLVEIDKKHPQGTPPPETLQFLKDNWKAVSAPFGELLSGLNLFGLAGSAKELKSDVKTIEGALNK